MKIASMKDVAELERTTIAERAWAHNTFQLISDAALRYGEAPALTWLPDARDFDNTHSWSFNALRAAIVRAANLFHGLGCGISDVIAYLLPNCPQAHFALWGAEAAGVAFALNPALSGDMIVHLLRYMQVKVLVVDPSILSPQARQALAGADLPDLEAVVIVGPDTITMPGAQALSYEDATARQPVDRLLSGRVFSPQDRSSAFCTGGTTGSPKVAIRSHGSEAVNAHMVALWLSDTISAGDTLFCGLPLFHVNAILVTGTMPWINGAHVLLGPAGGYRDVHLIANFWRMVEHFSVNLFSGVPTLYNTLLEVPIGGADVRSLKLGICGAAPMPVELFRRFEAATGIRIIEGYGLTESSAAAALNPPDGRRQIGSIGLRLPYQDMRIAVIDDTGAHEAEPGRTGTIAICGPNVFEGYADPAHDIGAWIDFGDGRRWLDTGDLGRVDPEGYFWLTGRKKEVIIRGGHNIDPKVIEEALHRHPDVALAAAVGRPDAHSGEIPVAYVQLREKATTGADALLEYARSQIHERAAVPKDIMIMDRLPMTAVGKLFKPALVLREIEKIVRAVAGEAGFEILALAVVQDPVRGMLASVKGEGDAVALSRALGRYAFAIEVTQVSRTRLDTATRV